MSAEVSLQNTSRGWLSGRVGRDQVDCLNRRAVSLLDLSALQESADDSHTVAETVCVDDQEEQEEGATGGRDSTSKPRRQLSKCPPAFFSGFNFSGLFAFSEQK